MDKNSMMCPWGDCPSLTNGPKSNEHEVRFLSGHKPVSQLIKNNSAIMINGVNARNPAK